MNEPSDWRFDIEALFENQVASAAPQDWDWVFRFRSNDLERLDQLAEVLSDQYLVQLQESTETIDWETGETGFGPPLLSAVHRASLGIEDLRKLATEMQTLADQHDVSYEGVECYDPVDLEAEYGWLSNQAAMDRLRYLSGMGLEDDAELSWTFLILGPSISQLESLTQFLQQQGLTEVDLYQEPNDQGQYGLCLFVEGQNNEEALEKMLQQLNRWTEPYQCHLSGVQFYTREEMDEWFGLDQD